MGILTAICFVDGYDKLITENGRKINHIMPLVVIGNVFLIDDGIALLKRESVFFNQLRRDADPLLVLALLGLGLLDGVIEIRVEGQPDLGYLHGIFKRKGKTFSLFTDSVGTPHI